MLLIILLYYVLILPVRICVFRDRGDTYYCMLFNDEVHTYEQVIYTLQKAVNCSQKEAVSFATTVDRDVSTFIMYTAYTAYYSD